MKQPVQQSSDLPDDEVVRDISGETWRGMRAVGYVYDKEMPEPPFAGGKIRSFTTHWSTVNHAERVYRESDVRKMLAATQVVADQPDDAELEAKWVRMFPNDNNSRHNALRFARALLASNAGKASSDQIAKPDWLSNKPEETGVGSWCAPGPASFQTRHFLLRFEDTERGDVLFEDELEARTAFANAEARGWNCHLFEHASRALASSEPAVAAIESVIHPDHVELRAEYEQRNSIGHMDSHALRWGELDEASKETWRIRARRLIASTPAITPEKQP